VGPGWKQQQIKHLWDSIMFCRFFFGLFENMEKYCGHSTLLKRRA
jgi:hypothetical protein